MAVTLAVTLAVAFPMMVTSVEVTGALVGPIRSELKSSVTMRSPVAGAGCIGFIGRRAEAGGIHRIQRKASCDVSDSNAQPSDLG